jgi:hypothetical protein
MAVPPFCYLPHERVACMLAILSGAIGLLLAATGRADQVQTWIPWATWNPGNAWLVGQSLLVILGGLGAWGGLSFTLALTGIVAALVFRTPVGAIAVIPGILLLCAIALRWRGFPGLAPRWKGGGPVPPGYWRR